MKDLTPSAFGLLISSFLPGLVTLFGISLWSDDVARWFVPLLNPGTNLDLLALVSLASLTVGLEVTLIRWLIFEKGLCRQSRLEAAVFRQLSNEHYLPAFRAAIEEHYRYHQFWGGMAVAMPVVFVGWLVEQWSSMSIATALGSLFAFVCIELLTGHAASVALELYVTRGKSILEGKADAERNEQEEES